MEMNEKMYVKNKENYIYELTYDRVIDSGEPFVHCYNLELVAGIDYIDYSDRQGYVSANNFTDEIQYDNLVVYSLTETILDRLAKEGYKVIKELPITNN